MLSFLLMLRRLTQAVKRNGRDPEFRALLYTLTLLLIGGTVFYWNVEGWSALDALYFSVITLATVGYGDFSPQTGLGKVFTIVYVLVGIGVFVALITKIAATEIQHVQITRPDDTPPE